MSPDEKRPIAEQETGAVALAAAQAVALAAAEAVAIAAEKAAAKQDAPLTQEEFAAQMQQLTERARAAGLNPIQTMAQTYARQGMIALEGLLGSLEYKDRPKKKA